MFDKIASFVKPFAPAIANALVGNVPGAVAGAAVALKQTFLGNDSASDEALLQAVQGATPEQKLALKQADYNFLLTFAQIETESQADARKQNVALSTNEKLPAFVVSFIALTPTFLSYINVVGFFFIALLALYFMHNGDISTAEVSLLSTLVGYGISEAKQTNTFHFGGSTLRDRISLNGK